MLLFITICCTDCYSFVLRSSLLISSVSHFVPVLYSTAGSWCILAVQMVCLPRNNVRLFIKYCTFFPFPSTNFAHVSVLLEILLSQHFSPKLHWLPHTPPSQPLALTLILLKWRKWWTPNNARKWQMGFNSAFKGLTLLADTTLLRLHHPHSSLYKLYTGATGFLLDSWTLRLGLIGCPEMLVRNYHYLLHINPEECSSQLLQGGSLKSHIVLCTYHWFSTAKFKIWNGELGLKF
jgi:hypothetical protein